MKLKVQRGSILQGEEAEADDIAYVVVLSNDGAPILAVEQVGRDHIQVTSKNDEAFTTILSRLGVL